MTNKKIQKALVTADLHLDINNRMEDKVTVLRQMTNYAIKNGVTDVFILGDIYERKRPYNSEKATFEKFVKYLADKDINVTILAGNHDTDKDGVSAVEEFKILDLNNIRLINNPSVVPFGEYKLLLGHFLINGAKLGPSDFTTARAVNLKDIFKLYKADIYLFGDVHKAQKLNENPPALYVGSPERNTFGERKEVKGFTLLEAGDKLNYKFIPLKTRKMIEFNITNITEWLVSDIQDVDKALVKVKITCSKEEYRAIKESEIIDKLKKAHEIKIEYNILKGNRSRTTEINEEQSVIDAFKNYAKFMKLDKVTTDLGLAVIKQNEH